MLTHPSAESIKWAGPSLMAGLESIGTGASVRDGRAHGRGEAYAPVSTTTFPWVSRGAET